jgi:choline dehydrogenase-like flavoprotein
VILDARGVADGTEIDCEVCVVGAGAAGITLARELRASSARVVVLESGGFDHTSETQALADGEVVGQNYAPLNATRVRVFGGSTFHWEGWCRPLEERDFAPRMWVPGSGWPLSWRELEPYYSRAQDICQLGPFDYRATRWAATGAQPLPLGDGSLAPAVYQFSPPTRFGVAYRQDLARASSVRVFLHANATQIVRRLDGLAVERIDAATLSGRRFTIKPRYVVVAAGGIENARLLLAWNLGNDRDLVGRYFAEHPHASAALVALPRSLGLSFYRLRDMENTLVRGAIATSARLERERRILRLAATLDRVADDPLAAYRSSAQRDAEEFGEDVAAVAQSLSARGDHELYALFARWEQAPNPDSRVTLGSQRDPLGVPKPRLDWRLSELDRRTVSEALKALALTLGGLGLGRVYTRPLDDEEFWPGVFFGHHHMGTTRMHDDPQRGVVDADCRIHGLDNVYVAGSSVFPTGGYANPTLTIVALSLRLAGHIRDRLG